MSLRHAIRVLHLLPLLSGCGSLPAGGEWPRFRGPNGSGVSDGEELPGRLDPGKDLAWKAAVPPGTSSPVVAGGRVFLSAAEGDERLVLAIDARSGKQLWRKAFPKVRSEVGSSMNGPASPTPAVGGGSVFVFFPDTGLISLSAEGEERWRTVPAPFKSMHGIASSPVLVDGKVVILIDQLERSYLEAFDAASGKPVWRTERPSGVTGGYSTPAVSGSGPGALLIAAGAIELAAYAAASGERVWWATGLTNAPIGLPVIEGERVYVCEPLGEAVPFKLVAASDKNGDGKISAEELGGDPGMLRLLERLDRDWGNGDGFLEATEFEKGFGTFVGNAGLVAVRLGGAGDVTRTHVVWRQTKSLSYVPSVLLYRRTLFAVKDGGILTTYDSESGKVERQARLDEAGGTYYASPVAGDGKVILVSTAGKVSVVKAEAQWSLLSSSDLGEGVSATPAIAGGWVFIRTEKSLYCFSAAPAGR